jgi:hypothetical protein
VPRPFQADLSPATAPLRQSQLSAPPATAKTQIALDKATVPIRYTAIKANAAVITQPSSPFETESPGHPPALNPHRLTLLPAQTPPAVSSFEAFPTPASVRSLTPVSGRRPKTLNITRHRPRLGRLLATGSQAGNLSCLDLRVFERRQAPDSMQRPLRCAPNRADLERSWTRRSDRLRRYPRPRRRAAKRSNYARIGWTG